MARASRVFVGQYDEAAADSATTEGEGDGGDMIGVDDESSPAETEIVAEGVSLDEETMRKIFGADEADEDPEKE